MKLESKKNNVKLILKNVKMFNFTFFYNLLSREAKRDMIHRLISGIEITRDDNYNTDYYFSYFNDLDRYD